MNYSRLAGVMAAVGALLLTVTPLSAEKTPPAKEPGKGARMRRMRRNAVLWRVFSQLNDAERKKMHDLQRNNPEAFTVEMRKLVDKYEQLERARNERLLSLIDKYRKSKDEKERAKLKDELTRMEKERFEQHLAGLSRTIANTRQRLAFMEKELNKRKAKKEAIVDARVEAMLTGKIPVFAPQGPPPPPPGPPGPPRRPPFRGRPPRPQMAEQVR
ncbi:MAG: hypothetical protein IKD44_01205 [Lentisphaeria bacterium]|nr:hypothetical protein [Lentisphaeria bacterium]